MFDISDLKEKKLSELQEIAANISVPKYKTLKKLDLIYQILDIQASNPKNTITETKEENPSAERKNRRTRINNKAGSSNPKDKERKAAPQKETNTPVEKNLEPSTPIEKKKVIEVTTPEAKISPTPETPTSEVKNTPQPPAAPEENKKENAESFKIQIRNHTTSNTTKTNNKINNKINMEILRIKMRILIKKKRTDTVLLILNLTELWTVKVYWISCKTDTVSYALQITTTYPLRMTYMFHNHKYVYLD